jgi:hypothetical protein
MTYLDRVLQLRRHEHSGRLSIRSSRRRNSSNLKFSLPHEKILDSQIL